MTVYACHNLPREAKTYIAQDGYYCADRIDRLPRYVIVPRVNSTNCRYDRAHADSRCAGCRSKATEIQ